MRFLGGVGLGTDAGPLDFDSLHTLDEVWSPTKKEFVVVAILVDSYCQPLEAIEIELSLEARDLGELEVVGKHLRESIWVVNEEASSMRLPGYDVRLPRVLDAC